MDISDHSSKLFPREKTIIENSILKRRMEFSTGRYALHLLLEENGIKNFPVLKDQKGMAVLPPRIAGSISHNNSHCIAVIAEKEKVSGIGVDLENYKLIDTTIHKYFLTRRELDLINTLPLAEQQLTAGIIFSAKEAFFKMLYSATGMSVNFHDFEIIFNKEPQLSIKFKPNSTFDLPESKIIGYYHHEGCMVYTLFVNNVF